VDIASTSETGDPVSNADRVYKVFYEKQQCCGVWKDRIKCIGPKYF
jgi:hypothetical protein